MCSTWISGGQDLPWLSVRVPGCAEMAPQKGKSRESALSSTDHQVTQQPKHSWRIPSAAAGPERLASQGPPAPSSEAPGSRLAHTPAAGAGTAAHPGLGAWKSHPSFPGEKGLRHQAARARRKSREEPLLLAHIKKHRGSCWERNSLTG